MKKVLIVDDHENNRTVLKLYLKNYADLQISEVSNGKEAVEACSAERFDIVLMDIMMPVMNGIEATVQIREYDKDVIIIALSALSDEENKQAMLDAGAQEYIAKPINPNTFCRQFEKHLAKI